MRCFTRATLLITAFTLAMLPGLSAQTAHKTKKKKKKKAVAAAKHAPPRPSFAPQAEPPAPAQSPNLVPPKETAPTSGDRDALTSFGLVLEVAGHDLNVLQVLPGSEAYDLGFKPGDVLLSLYGAETRTAFDAAVRIRARAPYARTSAVVRRALETVVLESEQAKLSTASSRKVLDLTPRESDFRDRQLEAAAKAAPDIVRRLPAPKLHIPARQTLWIQFPKGIPATVKPGDVLEGETVTPVVTDTKLDFLAVPARSQVWAQIVSFGSSEAATTFKLYLYKIKPAGGHIYSCSGRVKDVSGDQVLTKVSPGGTVVTAATPSGRPLSLIPSDTRYKVELLAPITMFEGPAFYQAGVGLWIHAVNGKEGKDRTYEVTQVVAGRSAAAANITAGDALYELGDVKTAKLDFQSAIGKLYGPPGSSARVKIQRAGSLQTETVSLVRGVIYEKGLGFSSRADAAGIEIIAVVADSPADKAGLKTGDRIIKIGTQPVSSLPAEKLEKTLSSDLTDENVLTVRRADSKDERRVSVPRGWVRAPLPLPYKP